MWKYLAVVFALGATLYAGIYVYASHSEAFEFAQEWILQSKKLETQIGQISNIRLVPFAGFNEKISGTSREVRMVIDATGPQGVVRVDLRLRKSGGTWAVTNYAIVPPNVS